MDTELQILRIIADRPTLYPDLLMPGMLLIVLTGSMLVSRRQIDGLSRRLPGLVWTIVKFVLKAKAIEFLRRVFLSV